MDILGRIRTELDSWFALRWLRFRLQTTLVLLILMGTVYDGISHYLKLWLPG